MSKLSLRNLHKSFGSKKVLTGIDLDIEAGESWVVLGGSGSGKSVLVKCILGLMPIDRGSMTLDGVDITGESRQERQERLRHFGMLFQGSALFDSLPIWENVAFGLLNGQQMAPAQARLRAIERLADVGLEERVADLYPCEISGGMQRRVGLARAIATDPAFLICDEPTSGLDPIFCGVISSLIRHCVSSLGATAITITHDIPSARRIADHIAMIYDGRIIWKGPADTLDTTDNAYVHQFIHGEPKGPMTSS